MDFKKNKSIIAVITIFVIAIVVIYANIAVKMFSPPPSQAEVAEAPRFSDFLDEAKTYDSAADFFEKYPDALIIVQQSPLIRSHCKKNSQDCLTLAKYLTDNPKRQKETMQNKERTFESFLLLIEEAKQASQRSL